MSRASGSEERERIVYEFDGFRADPVRRVLSRHGEPVAITPKALSILLILLERAGEVVEKRELIDKVWPGVFVGEANLTQNVFSLRKSLGERAADTRYVVTVPGQGYSFAAEVRRVERSAISEIPIVVEAPPAEVAAGREPRGEPPVPAPLEPPRRRLSPRGALAALLALVAIVAIVFALARRSRTPGTELGGSPVPAIAVLDFRSLSPGEETRRLDAALAEMLSTELAAGGSMRVIRRETVAQVWRSLALRDPGGLGRAELKRLHEALGADLFVVGSYLPIGGKIRLDLRVLQAPGGETAASLAEVGSEAALRELVSRSARKLRQDLGLAEPSPR